MRKICLIYTGGTIGMRQNPNGKLAPVDFEELRKKHSNASFITYRTGGENHGPSLR